MILEKLELENFKCYQKATIPFKNLSILVGENNAGKSCLIEALRLVSRAAQDAKRRVYINAPKEFDLPLNAKGFVIDTKKLKINLNIIIYYYAASKFAKITAFFGNKSKIVIYLNTNTAFAVIYDMDCKIVKTKQRANEIGVDVMAILPQIGPIRENEKLISYETVVGDKDTYLSSLHFRNEVWNWRKEYFNVFKEIAEKTWPGLHIDPITYNPTDSDYLSLLVEDNRFTAEIGRMGNGLQMWLQIMWFLSRSKDYELIILDEPDVYMHSDMQRKLLELVRRRFKQVIIATHSMEIISRVEPDNILEINKQNKSMHYANDSVSAQKIIDDIGGVQNLALLNLGRARKCLFVEGKDFKYLNRFNEIIYGKQLNIPNIAYGGFSKIPQIYGTSKLFFSETRNQIKCYALADRDYRDYRVVEKIISDANNQHLFLHVWKRKEIENYLIIPEVLFKFIPNEKKLKYDDFLIILTQLLDAQHDKVFDAISSQYEADSKVLAEGERWQPGRCNKETRLFMKANWTTMDKKIELVGGKDFLSEISAYFQSNFKVSITKTKIFEKMTVLDIPEEIKLFLKELQ